MVGHAGFLLQALHDRIVQLALVGEVPVDGALADPGALGDGPERQLPPVPGLQGADQRGALRDDPVARLGRALAAQRAVVPAPGPGLFWRHVSEG